MLVGQDCYIAGKDFVVEHAAIMGGVAIAISCIQVGMTHKNNAF